MYDVNTPDPSDFVDHSKAQTAVYAQIPDECFETGRFTAYYDTDGLVLQQINEYNSHRNIILRRRRIVINMRLAICAFTTLYAIGDGLRYLTEFPLNSIGLLLSAVGIFIFGIVLKNMYPSCGCVLLAFVIDLLVPGNFSYEIVENLLLYLVMLSFAFTLLWEITEKKFSKEKGYPKFLRIIVYQKEGTQAFFENFGKE